MRLVVKTKGLPSRYRGGMSFGKDAIEVDVSDEIAKLILADEHLVVSKVGPKPAPAEIVAEAVSIMPPKKKEK